MLTQIYLGVVCAVFGFLISFFFQSITKKNENDQTLKDIETTLDKYSEKLTAQFTLLLGHHVEVFHQDRTSELISDAISSFNMAVDYKIGVRDREISAIKQELEVKSKQLTKIQTGIIQILSKCDGCKNILQNTIGDE